MTTLTETRHTGEFILSEASGHRSREKITVLSGEGVLRSGAVLGRIGVDPDNVVVGDPAFTGTGNGVLTKATPAYGAGVQAGTYVIRLSEIVTDSGQFLVIRPDGTIDGVAVVGVAYDGQVKFTIADGSTDFSGAAQFTLAVTYGDPDSIIGKYRSADPTNTDGSAVARAVLLTEVDATSADIVAAAIVRSAEVNGNILTYDAAVDDAPKKATKVAELVAAGIVVR